ncbi:NAD(+) synthase [candidate division KSB1 bacterium]|nr:NAD(+) synthase [candidate division KSB1 bacterium]
MFDQNVLNIDCETELEKISQAMQSAVFTTLKRKGLVVAISGGVDSSVTAALAVKALGKDRVFGLLLPEVDSSGESVDLGRTIAEFLKIDYRIEDIGPALEAIGCYRWRDEAIRSIFPDYGEGWKNKIIISQNLLDSNRINFFKLVVQSPDGSQQEKRLPLQAYLQIVAATNFKQRIRKTMEYFHADRLNFAVSGTPNRLEYDQGFFVKNGDGSADVKPIAHLYKTQVYAFARYLGLPKEICDSMPTTDTYSLPQGQDEFYFVLPYDKMDLALYAFNHQVAAKDAASALRLFPDQVQRVYDDIQTKRRTTQYLHRRPILLGDVPEVQF